MISGYNGSQTSTDLTWYICVRSGWSMHNNYPNRSYLIPASETSAHPSPHTATISPRSIKSPFGVVFLFFGVVFLNCGSERQPRLSQYSPPWSHLTDVVVVSGGLLLSWRRVRNLHWFPTQPRPWAMPHTVPPPLVDTCPPRG